MLTFLKKHPIISITIIGFGLRIIVLSYSQHIYYADELYQTLEQGYRLYFGYGIIPWEFQDHIRSWVIPSFVYLLIAISMILNLEYTKLVALFFSTLSTTIIISIYYIFKQYTNKSQALVAAGSTAIWYELIYFTHRPFSEMISTTFLLAGIAIYAKSIILSSILMTIGCYLRPQYAIAIAIWICIHFIIDKQLYPKAKRHFKTIISASIATTIGLGLIDYNISGTWFPPLTNYLFPYIQSTSQLISETQSDNNQPWYYYIVTLLISSLGLYLAPCINLTKKRKMLLLLPLIVIGLHSLISNKQYRFVLLAIPILISLSATAIFIFSKKWIYSIHTRQIITLFFLCIVSFLGIRDNLPGQQKVYQQSILGADPHLTVYQQLRKRDDICGIYDTTRPWVLTGGYYYLNKPIPLYDIWYQPSDPANVNTIISPTQLTLDGYQQDQSHKK